MNGTLRVTPEKLISTAQTFSSTAGTVQNLTSSMLSTVESLSINKMVRMINEHSTNLQAMAQSYQEAERTAQETAATLQTDVIA